MFRSATFETRRRRKEEGKRYRKLGSSFRATEPRVVKHRPRSTTCLAWLGESRGPSSKMQSRADKTRLVCLRLRSSADLPRTRWTRSGHTELIHAEQTTSSRPVYNATESLNRPAITGRAICTEPRAREPRSRGSPRRVSISFEVVSTTGENFTIE